VKLVWPDSSFDIVVDYWALYANPLTDIKKTFSECFRVLKPNGYMYSRSWAQRRAGYDTGEMLEPGTSINPTEGPCANMGTSQIFGKDENEDLFSDFSDRQIRLSPVVNQKTDKRVIEWLVWAQK